VGNESFVMPLSLFNNASSYRSLIGSLLYLTASRPDLITLAASLLSRFMQNPEDIHFAASKRVLRYLKGTVQLGNMALLIVIGSEI